MDYAWLALTLDMDYLKKIADHIDDHDVGHMVLSHGLGHCAESYLEWPDRVVIANQLLEDWKARNCTTWAWTHEVAGLPEPLIPAAGELPDWEGIETFLLDKYDQLFGLLKNLDGLILLANETSTNLVRGWPEEQAYENLSKLTDIMHRACKQHGKRFALHTYTDRRHELEIFGRVLREAPTDIMAVIKHIPHDFHPFYPKNLLIGNVGQREVWVEFDHGLQMEMQNSTPYADVEALLDDLRYCRRHKVTMVSTRLDRKDGHRGQNALETPWGRLSLTTFKAFRQNPEVTVDQVVAQWESAEGCSGTYELIKACTLLMRKLLFPGGLLFSRHSRPHRPSIVVDYIQGRWRTEALSTWTGSAEDKRLEDAIESGEPWTLQAIADEDQDIVLAQATIARLSPRVKDDQTWARALDILAALTPMFHSHHRFVVAAHVHKHHPDAMPRERLHGYLERFVHSTEAVIAWSHEVEYFIHNTEYAKRNCKTAVSLQENIDDAREFYQHVCAAHEEQLTAAS